MKGLIFITTFILVVTYYATAEKIEEKDIETGYKLCTKNLKTCLKRWYCKQWPVKAMWCKCGKELVECCDLHFYECLQEDLNSLLVYNNCKHRYSQCHELATKEVDE